MAMDFFFFFKCIQKFKQPQKEERGLVPPIIKQESWDTVRVCVSILFEDIFEVTETWEQYVRNRTERETIHLLAGVNGFCVAVSHKTAWISRGFCRVMKRSFFMLFNKDFWWSCREHFWGHETVYSLKHLWGFWDCPVHKPCTVITLYWSANGNTWIMNILYQNIRILVMTFITRSGWL